MIKVLGRVEFPAGDLTSQRGGVMKFTQLNDTDPHEIHRNQIVTCGGVSSTIDGREKVCMYARVMRKGGPVDYNVGVFDFTTDQDACNGLHMALLMGSLSSSTVNVFDDVVPLSEREKSASKKKKRAHK